MYCWSIQRIFSLLPAYRIHSKTKKERYCKSKYMSYYKFGLLNILQGEAQKLYIPL